MSRICHPFSYGDGPIEKSYWIETASAAPRPCLSGDLRADVAVIGSGFTGLSAALRLAEAGRSVVVLDAKQPGWGASGRNGGFCCLGGAKLGNTAMKRRFGEAAFREYALTEKSAVDYVADLISRHGIEADTHSEGETILAHRAKDFRHFESDAREINDLLGVQCDVFGPEEMAQRGMKGPFYGGMTTPVGFGLNPRKYVLQLAKAAEAVGVRVFGDTFVSDLRGEDGAFQLVTQSGTVSAAKVVVATNGYSSETIPNWMRGRYIPAQSSIIVTRPLTDEDLSSQGWTSDQICYDTRKLLHYFRLMPNRRFLFGMRGGLSTSARVHNDIRRTIRAHFEQMFQGWAHVETDWYWSGFVCYSADQTPFAGEVPGNKGIYAGFAYHGNGVAMGTYCGALIADQILGQGELHLPAVIGTAPGRFPGGRFRRLAMWPAYLTYALRDL